MAPMIREPRSDVAKRVVFFAGSRVFLIEDSGWWAVAGTGRVNGAQQLMWSALNVAECE